MNKISRFFEKVMETTYDWADDEKSGFWKKSIANLFWEHSFENDLFGVVYRGVLYALVVVPLVHLFFYCYVKLLLGQPLI